MLRRLIARLFRRRPRSCCTLSFRLGLGCAADMLELWAKNGERSRKNDWRTTEALRRCAGHLRRMGQDNITTEYVEKS